MGLIGVAPHFRLPQVGIEPGSAAERAGLKSFDVILSVQGRAVESMADLEPLFFDRARSGLMLLVTYQRPRDAAFGFAAVATLEPRSAQIVPEAPTRPGHYDFGLRPADLYIHDVESGSPAARAGLEPGDVLVSLDGAALGAWEMFTQALEERPEDEHLVTWRTRSGEPRQAKIRRAAPHPRRVSGGVDALRVWRHRGACHRAGAARGRGDAPVRRAGQSGGPRICGDADAIGSSG